MATDTTPTTEREAHRFLLRVEQYIIHRVALDRVPRDIPNELALDYAIDNDPAALFIGEFVSRFETEMSR